MKELGLFRKFISEEKEIKVSEDKIEKAIKDTLEKEGGAAGIDPLKKAVKDLDVDKDFDIEKFLKKMSNVEKHKNGDYILTPLKEEQTNEIFGMGKNKEDMKVAKALDSLEKALFELNFLGVISDNDYMNFWMDKYGELYMDTMGELDPSVQKMYDYEGVEDMELEENDAVLDEIVKDAKFEIGDKVTMKAGGDEMEIVGARKMFGNNTQAYKVKKADGETVEYSANQLKKA